MKTQEQKGRFNAKQGAKPELTPEESFGLLGTIELNYEIEKMFRQESNFILILSPYLDLTGKIQAVLSQTTAEVAIVYRKSKKENKRIEELKRVMPKVLFYPMQDFHAKAYVATGTLIVSSLNLYQYSQINNFELGIIARDETYNKIIKKLFDELQLLFKANGHNAAILEKLKLPTVSDLFYTILEKSGKNEKELPDMEYLKQFSKIMLDKFSFDESAIWHKHRTLHRGIPVTRKMYEWALENVRL